MSEQQNHSRVALYARVSSGPQELSLDAQLHELRQHAAREGFEVIREVRDLAEKRHMIDRPGLNQVRNLTASGAIEEVWAVEFERFGEGNVPMLLAIELGAHGVRCQWRGLRARDGHRAPHLRHAGLRRFHPGRADVSRGGRHKDPEGGPLWSRDTIRTLGRQRLKLGGEVGEVRILAHRALLSGEVLAGLDPAKSYGVAYYGRTRSAYESMRSKRRKVERTPRSEWTAIPVPLDAAGLDRGQIERARALIADNRAPSKVGDYEYHLSRGFLFCADCGRAMVAYARRFPTRTHRYYRCDGERKARGTTPRCSGRAS